MRYILISSIFLAQSCYAGININDIAIPDWLKNRQVNMAAWRFNSDVTKFGDYKERLLVKEDKTALPLLYRLAQTGDNDAISLLGYIYDNQSKLVKLDPMAAAKLWHISAQHKDPVAMYNLGILYLNGRGVPKNIDTARQLFKLASDQGMGKAFYMLGKVSELKNDIPSAINAYESCLNFQLIPNCKTRYTILTLKTTPISGIQADKLKEYLVSANQQWDAEAQYTLARLYAEGILFEKTLPGMVSVLELLKLNANGQQWASAIPSLYNAYHPSEDDIVKGKEMARMAIGSDAGLKASAIVSTTKTVVEKGTIYK